MFGFGDNLPQPKFRKRQRTLAAGGEPPLVFWSAVHTKTPRAREEQLVWRAGRRFAQFNPPAWAAD